MLGENVAKQSSKVDIVKIHELAFVCKNLCLLLPRVCSLGGLHDSLISNVPAGRGGLCKCRLALSIDFDRFETTYLQCLCIYVAMYIQFNQP